MAIPPWITVIIPVLNEAERIGPLVRYLDGHSDAECEIVVVDGGSTDDTVARVPRGYARVLHAPKGRARQMNEGAKEAVGWVLYFVHADSLPPPSFQKDIEQALQEGHRYGGYRFRFDEERRIFRFNEYLTRFPWPWTRGGDQTLYMERMLFEELNGYDERYVIMEEYDLLRRARRIHRRMKVLPKYVVGSARKYQHNSYLRVSLANLIVYQGYRLGVAPARLKRWYSKLLR